MDVKYHVYLRITVDPMTQSSVPVVNRCSLFQPKSDSQPQLTCRVAYSDGSEDSLSPCVLEGLLGRRRARERGRDRDRQTIKQTERY